MNETGGVSSVVSEEEDANGGQTLLNMVHDIESDEDGAAEGDFEAEDDNEFEHELEELLAAFREQRQKGNRRYIETLKKSLRKSRAHVAETRHLRGRRRIGKTWERYQHPATNWYQ